MTACSLLVLMVIAGSCKINYSMTGASIPPTAKTISIPYFPNNAQLVVPTLSQTITDAVRDRFTSQTNLSLTNSGGDLVIEGSISGYTVSPVAIQGNETAGLNRLSIKVTIKFTNTINESQSFDNVTFERYVDYPSTSNLADVQDGLISQVTEQLVDDIFNKSVVNW